MQIRRQEKPLEFPMKMRFESSALEDNIYRSPRPLFERYHFPTTFADGRDAAQKDDRRTRDRRRPLSNLATISSAPLRKRLLGENRGRCYMGIVWESTVTGTRVDG